MVITYLGFEVLFGSWGVRASCSGLGEVQTPLVTFRRKNPTVPLHGASHIVELAQTPFKRSAVSTGPLCDFILPRGVGWLLLGQHKRLSFLKHASLGRSICLAAGQMLTHLPATPNRHYMFLYNKVLLHSNTFWGG